MVVLESTRTNKILSIGSNEREAIKALAKKEFIDHKRRNNNTTPNHYYISVAKFIYIMILKGRIDVINR